MRKQLQNGAANRRHQNLSLQWDLVGHVKRAIYHTNQMHYSKKMKKGLFISSNWPETLY